MEPSPAPSILLSGLFAGAEFALNQVLAMDDLLKRDLQGMAGTVMEISCTKPQLRCYVVVQKNAPVIRLVQSWEPSPTVSISGSLPALLELIGPEGHHSLSRNHVKVTGDIARAQQLQKALSLSNIDWEYHLARLFGDVPTQAMSDFAHSGVRNVRQAGDSLRQNLDEYIHEEKRLLPGRIELETFYRDIDDLRLRTDRLAARINRLQGTGL